MTISGTSLISNSLPLIDPAQKDVSGRLDIAKRQADPKSTADVAKDFESIFASMLLKEMRQTLEPGSMFGEDSGDIYGGLFDRFVGEHMTKGQGLGLAKMFESSMQRMQRAGKQQPAAPAESANSISG